MLNEDSFSVNSSSHSCIDENNEESDSNNTMGPCDNDESSVASNIGSIRTLPLESDLFH